MSRRRSLEIIMNSAEVTIGELVQLTGVRYSTLKHYTEIGLLPFRQDEEKITRRFNREQTINYLELIRSLKEAGQSIPEITEYMKNSKMID